MRIEKFLPERKNTEKSKLKIMTLAYNQCRYECICKLEQAAKEGKICLDVPNESELRYMIIDYVADHSGFTFGCGELAKKISERLRR